MCFPIFLKYNMKIYYSINWGKNKANRQNTNSSTSVLLFAVVFSVTNTLTVISLFTGVY
jgi:hypothetical protein